MSKNSDLPKHDDLFVPVVRAFRELDGSADNEQLVEKVTEILALPDELTAIPHKDGPGSEIAYRVAWVKSWLKWGKMLDNPQRGIWTLTEIGRSASDAEIAKLPSLRRAASPGRRSKTGKSKQLSPAQDQPAAAEDLEELAEEHWKQALLDQIKGMKPPAFERLSRLLLLRLGFSHVEVVGRSGDGGIDLMGTVRVNSVISFRVLAQCKRYKETVGPGDVRNFRGAMTGRTDKALFITTGRYTREAKNEATRDGVPSIDLIDGAALCLLLKDLGMGVETKMVEKVILVPEFFSAI